MTGISRDAIAYWEAKREGRHSWQQGTSAQSAKAAKGKERQFNGKSFRQGASFAADGVHTWALRRTRARTETAPETDFMSDLLLRPGVAVVYPSILRYAAAPEEAFTVDMFDAEATIAQTFYSGTARVRLIQHTCEFNTMMVLREELPEFMTAKMSALHVALKSCQPERAPAAFVVTIPGIGAAHATGAFWIMISKEDLRGTRWE